jgi:hypothetical protein
MTAWDEYKKAWGKCESQAIILGKSESQASMEEEKGNSSRREDNFYNVDFWTTRESWCWKRAPAMLCMRKTMRGMSFYVEM